MGYNRILVGTDGSATADKAVQTAAALARAFGAELYVVSARRSSVPLVGGLEPLGADVYEQDLAESQKIAEAAAATWGEGLATRAQGVPGLAADAIVGTAQEAGADLIVVGNKGMRGAGRLLGSVPNSVAHRASCAVLIVKTG